MQRPIHLLALLTVGLTGQPALAQDIAPEHADAWAFMQENMPGVSYDLLVAACQEGQLTIYNGTWGDAQRAQMDAFRKRFPCVSTTNFELGTGARRERFLSETRAGLYIVDIVQDTDPGSLNEQAEAGLLMAYAISNDDAFDPAVKLTGYWYPLRVGISGNAWNTDNVTPEEAEALLAWETMLDPAFKGRVGIGEPTGGATLLPYYGLHKTFGEEFMKKFAELEPRIFPLNELGSALASGEIDIALATSETPLTTLHLLGAPIQWSLPEPSFGPATGQAIAANAPHPNAAKLYQEYSFTVEGYGAWQKLGGPPARKDFHDEREVAQEEWYKYPTRFFEYDPDQVTAEQAEFLKLFDSWFRSR